MQLIDTHTHIYLEQFDKDRNLTVKQAIDNGVTKLLLPNVDENTIAPMLELCDVFPHNCIPMMGLHPTSIKENYKKQLEIIENQLNKTKYCAIGETGIDLYWDKTFFKEQCYAFEKHIEWAVHYDLPLVIHSRNSLKEIFSILEKSKNIKKLRGVFHCFPGDLNQAHKAVELGFKIGIGGVVTYKNSKMAEVAESIDLNHILLETDSPYLAPVPKRGKRNESSFLVHIAEKISEIKKNNIAEVAAATTQNAINLFMLDKF